MTQYKFIVNILMNDTFFFYSTSFNLVSLDWCVRKKMCKKSRSVVFEMVLTLQVKNCTANTRWQSFSTIEKCGIAFSTLLNYSLAPNDLPVDRWESTEDLSRSPLKTIPSRNHLVLVLNRLSRAIRSTLPINAAIISLIGKEFDGKI